MTHREADKPFVPDERTERAIRQGIDFLLRSQLPSGEFVTVVAKDEHLSIDARHDPSPFATAHIVSSLCTCGMPEAAHLIRSAIDFLLSQRLPGKCWKFWGRGHPGFANIPPDVDDTSVVSMALQEAGSVVAGNESILLANRDSRGFFYTWIWLSLGHARNPASWLAPMLWLPPNAGRRDFFHVGEARRDDVDIVVNTNAVCWLAGFPNETKPARDWIMRALSDGSGARHDRYYQSEEAFHYAVIRCLRAGVQGLDGAASLIANAAQSKIGPDGSVGGSVQRTALTAIALAATGASADQLQPVSRFLASTQRPDGSWPGEAFYYGGWSRDIVFGSDALTTAFCIEAHSLLGRNEPS
jgi:hypothetical protein